MDKMLQKEKYRIVLVNMLHNKDVFQVVVPSRQALGELMTILPSSVYFVSSIEVLDSVKDFRDFFNQLAEERYPSIPPKDNNASGPKDYSVIPSLDPDESIDNEDESIDDVM